MLNVAHKRELLVFCQRLRGYIFDFGRGELVGGYQGAADVLLLEVMAFETKS
jgi:hypothetical protein